MRVPLFQNYPPAHPANASSSPNARVNAPPTVGDESTVSLLISKLLIPGRGDPIENGALAIKADKIEWVGSANSLPSKYKDIQPTYVRVLMPGLWDCHCHFMGIDVVSGMDGLIGFLPGMNALVGAVSVDDFRATIEAGYTTVRELGGYAGDLWPAIQSGAILGPNVYSAIAALSITGGHGDEHTAPLTTVLEAANRGGAPIGICDGVEECQKTVRTMVRRGARVIKVCSSGGVLSLNDDPEDRQFSDAELSAIVEEAGRSRRAVAAHAIGKAGIMAALRAGVRSIEHGMYLDEEVVSMMKEKDATLVATQHIVRIISTDYFDSLPPKMQRKVLSVRELSLSSYRLAVKSGVRIALGTDMVSSDRRSRLSHGNNAYELVYAVEAGMTPLQAIESATANGPGTLGGLAPKSGQLREGYDADIIAVVKSPLDDIEVLTETANISHVWKGGKLVKQPTLPRLSNFPSYAN